MKNERFCQNTLLARKGLENLAHPEWFAGQVSVVPAGNPAKADVNCALFRIDARPAG
jgi:hypothetical protein